MVKFSVKGLSSVFIDRLYSIKYDVCFTSEVYPVIIFVSPQHIYYAIPDGNVSLLEFYV